MRDFFLILVCCLAVVCQAQEVLYADTFRLQDQSAAVDDSYLLDLLSVQSDSLHRLDSLRRDSLLQALERRDSLLRSQLVMVQDSIHELRKDEIRQAQIEDSLAQVAAMNDSISTMVGTPQIASIELPMWDETDTRKQMKTVSDLYKAQHSHWNMLFGGMLHITQNYVSHNWYAGGISSFAVLSQLHGEINYKKDNLSWTNTGELRLGGATTSADTLRKGNVTEDLLKWYSKFGYQVVKSLYISASADFQTQLLTTWKENQMTAKTATFSPIRFNLALGVDYQPVRNLSIVVSPLTYKLVYSMKGNEDGIVDVTAFGIMPFEHILNDVGSSMRVTYKWKPIREIALSTEFYFYTNYKKVELDWEINADFIINRFLTARLQLHPRYDNTIILLGDEKAKMQFKEILSIGFSHKFRRL